MAQPFSPQQRAAIREKLKESARKYAVSTGVKKTSLDMLTADAGISKSSFYKFYDSKRFCSSKSPPIGNRRSSPP